MRSSKPLSRFATSTTTLPSRGPAGSGSPRSRACGAARPPSPSPRSAEGGRGSWPGGPSHPNAPRPAPRPAASAASRPCAPGPRGARPSSPGTSSSCPRRGRYARGRSRGSTRRRCREVAVVGDRQHRTGVRGEVLLEPEHALRVEVVRRLVEQEQVRPAQQELAQRHAAPLAPGQVHDRKVRRRAAQCVHRLLELRVDLPRVGVVEHLLQLAELLHELVAVVGGHLFGDGVVPVEFGLDLAEALLDVAEDGLLLVQRGSCWRMPTVAPGCR